MNEQRAIYAAMLLIGTPLIIVAIARGSAVSGAETLAGLLVLIGIGGLAVELRTTPKLPNARALSVRDPRDRRRGTVTAWTLPSPPDRSTDRRARMSSRSRPSR